jgi:hypothetical protein
MQQSKHMAAHSLQIGMTLAPHGERVEEIYRCTQRTRYFSPREYMHVYLRTVHGRQFIRAGLEDRVNVKTNEHNMPWFPMVTADSLKPGLTVRIKGTYSPWVKTITLLVFTPEIRESVQGGSTICVQSSKTMLLLAKDEPADDVICWKATTGNGVACVLLVRDGEPMEYCDLM